MGQSWYCPYRKRFDRAEAEYVTAKLDLQRKTDIKEQLTEHLCTIIQQNELRKARKLEELMQQLDVQADEALELDVEVERLLHEQEAEAGRQKVRGERPWEPSGESVTSGPAQNQRHQAPAACPQVCEQGENAQSTVRSPAPPDQEETTAANDRAAALAT